MVPGMFLIVRTHVRLVRADAPLHTGGQFGLPTWMLILEEDIWELSRHVSVGERSVDLEKASRLCYDGSRPVSSVKDVLQFWSHEMSGERMWADRVVAESLLLQLL